jgi:hypothetical protein
MHSDAQLEAGSMDDHLDCYVYSDSEVETMEHCQYYMHTDVKVVEEYQNYTDRQWHFGEKDE